MSIKLKFKKTLFPLPFCNENNQFIAIPIIHFHTVETRFKCLVIKIQFCIFFRIIYPANIANTIAIMYIRWIILLILERERFYL